MAKKTVGIILTVLGIALCVITIMMVGLNLDTTGPIAGKITSYTPPFRNHGLLTIFIGLASAISFLGGVVLIALEKRR